MTLVLASRSPARAALLAAAAIPHEVRPAPVDEDAIRAALLAEGASTRDLADTLAEHKARKIALRQPEARVLGADQVLDLKGTAFAKPADRAEAAEHLRRLSGQTHRLLSAAVLYDGGEPVWRHVGVARLTMHALTEDEIAAYLDRAWPDVAGCVGAYQAEGLGARLFSRIEGDWFSVLGLPLLELCAFLRLRGWLTP